MKRSIVWLASYPKSGNTWMRVFLANYLSNAKEPLSLRHMQQFAVGDSIPRYYEMAAGTKIDTTDFGVTLQLRDRVLRGIIANNADVNLVKTHSIRSHAMGMELIPPQYTRQAIYILRNPLDMLISYARHFGMTHEKTAEALGRSDNGSAGGPSAVTQFFGSWSEHVKSWTKGAPFPVLTVRYEDLLNDPTPHFGAVIKALGVPCDNERLERAIHFSRFDELKTQEEQQGFAENSEHNNRFFNTGRSDQWKDALDPKLISKVRRDHKRVMKEYGYYNA